jgi:hypothetical protein
VELLCHNLQDLAIEGAVEFANSISEHGLTPAAVRSYVTLMNDRLDSLSQVFVLPAALSEVAILCRQIMTTG